MRSFLLLAIALLAGIGPAQALLPIPCTGRTGVCILQILGGFIPPLPSRLADCSSYQRVVVTPSPTTVTTVVATQTVTVTTTLGALLAGRGEIVARQTTSSPTAVPTYLGSPCTQAGIYGSACACLGIQRTTSTAPTPTITTSVTTTTTTTVTVNPVPTCTGDVCGSYTPVNYGEGVFSTCACGIDVNGDSVCFVVAPCISVTCATNADCASGSRCIAATCCGDNICLAEATNQNACNTAINQTLDISSVGVNGTECTSLGCSDGAGTDKI
ncbi:hypothetical protein N7456_012313 [Penicillium angulare]|uniref:Uncharacterized protein n=1 Tax=Penicillium angulare TaxID=116970 RepID=A0A9W9K1J8_9EURO|nr:hypothetical protein N7456_012313 [Penicillium angulare]